MKHATPKMSSIEKALKILMTVADNPDETGTVELSQKLGFHPATVSRILQILKDNDFLQHTKNRKVTLGASTFRLGKAIFQFVHPNLHKIAIPYLEELSKEVGETVILETRAEREMLVSYVAQGKESLAVSRNVGDRLPFHVSSGGKAILAFANYNEADFPAMKLDAYTPNTITDIALFKHQLEEVRKQGVAFSREELVIGVNTMSAPILDGEGKPVAAILIAGLASRIPCRLDSPMVAALKRAVRNVTNQLILLEEIANKKLAE